MAIVLDGDDSALVSGRGHCAAQMVKRAARSNRHHTGDSAPTVVEDSRLPAKQVAVAMQITLL